MSADRSDPEISAAAPARSRLSLWLARSIGPGGGHWEVPLFVVVVGAGVLLYMWNRDWDDRSTQIIHVYYVSACVVALLAIWWTLFSGLQWITRVLGLAGVAATAVGLLVVFRLDGFTGDFIPIFSLRSRTSPEQRAVAYFGSQARAAAPTSEAPAEPLVVTPDDWPQFRGPTRLGVVSNVKIRQDWNENPPKLLWKHPVGKGWSSFAVVGNLAFTQEQRGADEVVVCYDVHTGEQVWVHADRVRYSNTMGGDGPRATPTVFDSRLYAMGGTGILNCLDPRTGEVLWTHDVVADAGSSIAHFGMSTSPFIYDNLVVVNAGGDNNRGVIAYNRTDGEIVWAHGDRKAGYASPVLATFDGVRQLLIFGALGLAGHDAQTGEELWWFPWENETDNNCVDPIVLDDGTIFLSTGYSKGTALLDVRRTAGKWAAEPVRWKTTTRFKAKINGPVVKDGYIYGLDEGILCCFDPAGGEQKWKRGRYGYGQVLLVDDVILVSTETGEVALVEANPERYREIARFKAIEGKTWNHPALCRGLLLIRNDEEAACFDLRPDSK